MTRSHIHTRLAHLSSNALRSAEPRRFTSAFTASHCRDVIVLGSMAERSTSRQFGRSGMVGLKAHHGREPTVMKLYRAGLFT
jgi:hypothetical protein